MYSSKKSCQEEKVHRFWNSLFEVSKSENCWVIFLKAKTGGTFQKHKSKLSL